MNFVFLLLGLLLGGGVVYYFRSQELAEAKKFLAGVETDYAKFVSLFKSGTANLDAKVEAELKVLEAKSVGYEATIKTDVTHAIAQIRAFFANQL